MPFDATPQSLEQRVSALLATPEPLKAWLRTQPPDESAGVCGHATHCVIGQFLQRAIGLVDVHVWPDENPRQAGIVFGGSRRREIHLPTWANELGNWFDNRRQDSTERPGPTHVQVLQHLEST